MTENNDGRAPERALPVSEHEFWLIVSGLRFMRRKIERDMRHSKARGFVPCDGRGDKNKLKLQTLRRLMDRLGIEGRGDK